MTMNKTLNLLSLAAAVAISVAFMSTQPLLADDDDDDDGGTLPGSYNVDVCVRVTNTPVISCGGGDSDFLGFFRALITFNADRTLTEADNFPGGVVPGTTNLAFSFSDGHGNWRRARGRNMFVGTSHKVRRVPDLFQPTDNRYDRVLIRFRSNGDTVRGSFLVIPAPGFLDLAGTFEGPRVAIETF